MPEHDRLHALISEFCADVPDHADAAPWIRGLLAPGLQDGELFRLAFERGQSASWQGQSLAQATAPLLGFMAHALAATGSPRSGSGPSDTPALADSGARLTRAVQYLQEGHAAVQGALNRTLLSIQSQLIGWAESGDFHARVVRELEALTGIVAVAAGKPDENNRYVTEFANPAAIRYLEDIARRHIDTRFQSDDLGRLPPTLRAMVKGELQTAGRYSSDPGLQNYLELHIAHGFQSVAAFPLFDRGGVPRLVYTLWGKYPGQFESEPMRVWLSSLRHVLEQRYLLGENPKLSRAPMPVSLRSDARSALHAQGLQMLFQPIVDLRTRKLVSVEALARLQLRSGTVLVPGIFLKALSNADLDVLFTQGLKLALQQVVELERMGLRVNLSINLPPSVLAHADFMYWVQDALRTAGIEAQRLGLEFLEVEDEPDAMLARVHRFNQLRDIGVGIEMDDLGAGASGLRRLHTLPFSGVKLDRELTEGLRDGSERSRLFFRSVLRLGRELGLRVVVEGLETRELVDRALELGAELAQGYAIARPMEWQRLPEWAREGGWLSH